MLAKLLDLQGFHMRMANMLKLIFQSFFFKIIIISAIGCAIYYGGCVLLERLNDKPIVDIIGIA